VWGVKILGNVIKEKMVRRQESLKPKGKEGEIDIK